MISRVSDTDSSVFVRKNKTQLFRDKMYFCMTLESGFRARRYIRHIFFILFVIFDFRTTDHTFYIIFFLDKLLLVISLRKSFS